MPVDTHQFPLLEEITEVVLGEGAIARRTLIPPPELDPGDQTFPPSFELEFMAQVGALIYPGRVCLKLREAKWAARVPELPEGARMVGRARKEGDGQVTVTLSAENRAANVDPLDGGQVSVPLCRAVLTFGHVYQPSGRPSSAQAAPSFSPQDFHNGRWLYFLDAQELLRVPGGLQIIDWAQLVGLGRIQGEMLYPSQILEGIPLDRFQLAPPALDGALQLVHWLWYGFAGESSRIMGIEEVSWHRLPRRDERILGEAQLRGTSQGMVLFDVSLYGSDGAALLDLRRVRVSSSPPEAAPPPPRLAWQSFLRRLTQL